MRVDWRREFANPDEVERKLAMLLLRIYEDARHIDGSGGDGGRDVELRTANELTFWECKSFPDRLTNSRKSQIVASLTAAAQHQPDHWWLVVPMLFTPDEIKWFDKLRSDRGFEFISGYRDRTWIDGELALHQDLLRSFQSVHEELLSAAKQWGQETAVLAGGVADVASRASALTGLANEMSPDYAVKAGIDALGQPTIEITPKREGVGPLIESLTFDFPDDDLVARQVSDRLDDAVMYGQIGEVRVPGKYISNVTIADSARALALPVSRDKLEAIGLVVEAEDIDLPLTLAIYEPGSAFPMTSMRFDLQRRGSGQRGFTLKGADSAGTMTISITVAFQTGEDTSDHGSRVSATITTNAPKTILPANALPAMRLATSMHPPNIVRMSVQGHELGSADAPALLDQAGLREGIEILHATEDLAYIQERLQQVFPLPANFRRSEIEKLADVRSLLDGKTIDRWAKGTMSCTVVAASAKDFLAQFPEKRFAMLANFENAMVPVGGENIILGAIRYYCPNASIRGRAALGRLSPDDQDAKAEFVPSDGWFSAQLLSGGLGPDGATFSRIEAPAESDAGTQSAQTPPNTC